jgi:hypothetical protein
MVMGLVNRFLFEVHCSKSARNEEPSSRGAFNNGLASADSGLQLNLEIAQAVSQRRSSPLFSWAEGALKRRVT